MRILLNKVGGKIVECIEEMTEKIMLDEIYLLKNTVGKFYMVDVAVALIYIGLLEI